jgi:hypothetical protein
MKLKICCEKNLKEYTNVLIYLRPTLEIVFLLLFS